MGVVVLRQVEKTKHAEPIVDCNHHHVALGGKDGAVVVVAGTDVVGAAVNPEQHRPGATVRCGGVDVHRQTVLTECPRRRRADRGFGLHRAITQPGGIQRARPGPMGFRRTEASFTHRGLGIGDALEALDIVFRFANNSAKPCSYRGHRTGRRGGCAVAECGKGRDHAVEQRKRNACAEAAQDGTAGERLLGDDHGSELLIVNGTLRTMPRTIEDHGWSGPASRTIDDSSF